MRELSAAERAAWVERAAPEELDRRIRQTPLADLIAIARASVPLLGTYAARMLKQERVDGRLLDLQTVELRVREKPFAALMRYREGPGAGRVVFYDEALRKDALRAREGGLLGLAGGLWISLDSSLTRKDSNHSVRDVGFGAIVALVQADVDAAAARGGMARADEGLDERGNFCMRFTAPAGAPGVRGERSRVCVDPSLGLPVHVEVEARGQLQERYSYDRVETGLAGPAAALTLESAGL